MKDFEVLARVALVHGQGVDQGVANQRTTLARADHFEDGLEVPGSGDWWRSDEVASGWRSMREKVVRRLATPSKRLGTGAQGQRRR